MVLRIFGRAFRNPSLNRRLESILPQTDPSEEKPVLGCIAEENIIFLKPHWFAQTGGDEIFQEGDETLRGENSRGIIKKLDTPSGNKFGLVEETKHAWVGYLCRPSTNGIWSPAIIFRRNSEGYGRAASLVRDGSGYYPGCVFSSAVLGAVTFDIWDERSIFSHLTVWIILGSFGGSFFKWNHQNFRARAFEQIETTKPEAKKIFQSLQERL